MFFCYYCLFPPSRPFPPVFQYTRPDESMTTDMRSCSWDACHKCSCLHCQPPQPNHLPDPDCWWESIIIQTVCENSKIRPNSTTTYYHEVGTVAKTNKLYSIDFKWN